MKKENWNKLSKNEQYVLLEKGTEPPFSGKYYNHFQKGKYVCKQCNSVLFSSEDKFNSNCGWPSFDDEINDSVKKVMDKDGRRTEILCRNCNGHLGHIFIGENLTNKNTRYCVNSISIDFKKED